MLAFLNDLKLIAPAAGGGAFAFVAADGKCRGWVQFIIRSDRQVEIHRLWTLHPGQGNGSFMLSAVCELADRHNIEMVLKTLPFGRKPYPLSREQLRVWYSRHGFEIQGRKMVRRPRTRVSERASAIMV
jgi:GNAT superfamily N-acetyltransferase